VSNVNEKENSNPRSEYFTSGRPKDIIWDVSNYDDDMHFSLLIDKKAFFKSYKWFFQDEISESLTVGIQSNYNSCDESNIKDVQTLIDMLI
jgi:hypothetical protein